MPRKKCQCGNEPTYCLSGKISRKWCSKCKPDNAVYSKNCACGKSVPTYGLFTDKKRIWCKKCKPLEAINLTHKLCECGKHLPSYNLPNIKTPKWCRECKPITAIDVINKKCGCGKIACFNFIGEIKGKWCSQCKPDNTINVRDKHCKEKNCLVKPCFNFEGLSALYCTEHKKEGMIDVKNKKCIEIGCNIIPRYGFEGEKMIYCAEHKKKGMIDLKSKRCIENNCNIIPIFNYIGKKTALYCVNHKKEGMVDVKNKRKICKECNLINVEKSKYGNYCVRCFIHLFPDEPISSNYKIKEKHVFDAVLELLPKDLNIIRDKTVGGCSKRRPDLMIDCGSHWICAENDEDAHKDYDTTCENKRMMELYTDMGNRPMVLIRFNCDKYSGGGSLFKMCRKTGISVIKSQKEFRERITKFAEVIKKYIESEPPEKAVTFEYLYYDKILKN